MRYSRKKRLIGALTSTLLGAAVFAAAAVLIPDDDTGPVAMLLGGTSMALFCGGLLAFRFGWAGFAAGGVAGALLAECIILLIRLEVGDSTMNWLMPALVLALACTALVVLGRSERRKHPPVPAPEILLRICPLRLHAPRAGRARLHAPPRGKLLCAPLWGLSNRLCQLERAGDTFFPAVIGANDKSDRRPIVPLRFPEQYMPDLGNRRFPVANVLCAEVVLDFGYWSRLTLRMRHGRTLRLYPPQHSAAKCPWRSMFAGVPLTMRPAKKLPDPANMRCIGKRIQKEQLTTMYIYSRIKRNGER